MAYQFPLRTGNDFTFLVDGQEIWPALLQDLDNAQQAIYIEMYLVESGALMNEIIAALTRARQREVAVYFLLDHFGAWYLSRADVYRMTQAGIHVALFNPVRLLRVIRSLHRTHRKIIVIDNEIAYTGGIGFTDEFDHRARPASYWHDTAIRICGSCVADWYNLFASNWKKWSPVELPDDISVQPSNSDSIGRVLNSQSLLTSEIRRSLLRNIRSAKTRVWIATAYFIPSRKLRRALKHAARRNVDVRILVPGPITDNPAARYLARRYYGSLLRAEVNFFEYQPRFLHSKIFLCDEWVSTGSTNLDRWNLTWNLDANQEVPEGAIEHAVLDYFRADFERATPYHLEDWKQRSFKERLLERFWGWVFLILSGFKREPVQYKKH